MLTFTELFTQVYITPQELSTETGIPIEAIYHARNGQSIRERDARRIVRAISTRLGTSVSIYELPHKQMSGK